MFSALTPYLTYLKIAAAVAIIVGAFVFGHHVAALACKAAQVAVLQATEKAKDAEAAKDNNASQDLEAQRNAQQQQQQVVVQTVDKIIDRPIYRNVCLDADGVRAVNSAITGASPDAGKPDAAVPAPAATH